MRHYNGYLSNYPEFKKKLIELGQKIITISNSENGHLGDIGCIACMYSKELKEVGDEMLRQHDQLNNSPVS